MAAILARMEVAGIACAPSLLARHRAAVQARLAQIEAAARALAGRDTFNVASRAQLAAVLYGDLGLPAPTGRGARRGAAKTHAPTDEAALKALAPRHPLPALALEHRCLVNFRSKWLDAPWVRAAAAAEAAAAAGGAAGGGVARVRCCWSNTGAATGRLSCSAPNLQAVTRYAIEGTAAADGADGVDGADGGAGGSGGPGAPPAALASINVRSMFVAPPGRLLLSADFSQVELRMLAHLSGDEALCALLRRGGDVLTAIAESWLEPARRRLQPDAPPGAKAGDSFCHSAAVALILLHTYTHAQHALHTKTQPTPYKCKTTTTNTDPGARDTAKRVVYGIVYGLGAPRLAEQLREHGAVHTTPRDAQALINTFLAAFPGVRAFAAAAPERARRDGGGARTLLGRWRPIAGLGAPDAAAAAEAARRAVNTPVQGSAADLIKLAMAAWDDFQARHGDGNGGGGDAGAGGAGGGDAGAGGGRGAAAAAADAAIARACTLVASIHGARGAFSAPAAVSLCWFSVPCVPLWVTWRTRSPCTKPAQKTAQTRHIPQ